MSITLRSTGRLMILGVLLSAATMPAKVPDSHSSAVPASDSRSGAPQPGPQLPPGVGQDWWSQVQANIQREEYNITWQDETGLPGLKGAYQAPNRAQGFRTAFMAEGILVEPMREEGAAWTWGLSLAGAEAGSWKPEAGEKQKPGIHATDNRIEFDRGWVTEWYVNSPEGLEQGFTIPAPLPAASSQQPVDGEDSSRLPATDYRLHLDLRLTGTLHPRFADDGQAVDFWDSGNISVLRYAQLKVTDATGRVLPSHIEGFAFAPNAERGTLNGSSGGVRIIIDAQGAVFPITVDPLTTSPTWSGYARTCDGKYGYSVATAGDVNGDGYSDVIVGVRDYSSPCGGPGDNVGLGRAALYLGGPSGLSTSQSWGYSGSMTYSYAGAAVSTAGDVNGDGYSDVLVGVPGLGSGGVVFLFKGGPSGLSTGSDWAAYGSVLGVSSIGSVIGAAGDVNGDGYSDVLITAPDDNASQGAAFLFTGGQSGLSSAASWSAVGETAGDAFGSSAATAGDVNGDGFADVVIAAKNWGGGTGKTYVYWGGSSGLSSTASWTGAGATAGDLFGSGVMTAGDVDGDGTSDLLVGASGYSGNTGRAYLFQGGPTGLATSPVWTATGEAGGNYFGSSVATAGDINGDGYADALVSAKGYGANAGKVTLYLGGPSGLSTASSWAVAGATAGDNFGGSIQTAGDVNGDGFSDIVVGADSYHGGFSAGAAFLYQGSAAGPAAASSWTASGEAISSYYGWSLASAGDVNGDGYSDVVVGAYFFNGAAGKAYLYLGGASGLAAAPSWAVSGEAASNYFGISVSGAGDVNGDGYADVVVGAKNYTSGTGKAYLYLGGAAGLSGTALWSALGEATGSYFGNSAASAGDVNGDGYSDLLVGAYGYGASTGRAYLYLGSASGPSPASAWTATGESSGNYFAYSVATAGDVNGDGYSDVVIGAYAYNSQAGKAYVYLGGPSGLSPAASWSQAGAAIDYRFGISVATAGDVNGDGFSDVAVGANFYNTRAGKAYLYLGGASGLSAGASWTVDGEAANNGFGGVVASAGDVNGDGYSDFIVGAAQYGSNSGKAYLYFGSAAGPSTTASWTAVGAVASGRFCYSAASAGDVNGDGYSDLVIGAPYATSSIGSAYLYYGNGGAGMLVRPRQLRSDLSAPVAPGGNAYEQAFRINLRVRSPFGRIWAKPEWQVAPLLGSFNPLLNPPQSPARWWDTGPTGISLNEMPDISEMEGPWIWRARAQYSSVKSPFQSHGPWFALCANGARETDLRSTAAAAPPACILPDEPCWLYSVVKSGTDYTLNFQDPNQSNQRTGWNIRRSNNAALPKSTWPLVGTNVVDMDAGAVNYQWTDHSGADPSPSLVWYYQVTTYNANCPAEGPF